MNVPRIGRRAQRPSTSTLTSPYATVRYLNATQDTEFERECGTELLVETARLWASLGHHDPRGGFRIDGVTGPDEYSAVVDNNIYTNLMAQRNLRAAADACERHPGHRRGTRGRPRRGHGLAGGRT
jgi:trehalose/maltose hydrolase-like predicted phosphorylase